MQWVAAGRQRIIIGGLHPKSSRHTENTRQNVGTRAIVGITCNAGSADDIWVLKNTKIGRSTAFQRFKDLETLDTRIR